MVAEGLAALINDQADMEVVGNVGTVAECETVAAKSFFNLASATCRRITRAANNVSTTIAANTSMPVQK